MEESQSILIPKIEITPPPPKKRNLKIWWGILIFFLILFIYLSISTFIIYKKGNSLFLSAKILNESVKEKDLKKINNNIGDVNKNLKSLTSSYKLISWVRVFPYIGGYVSDVGHLLNAGNAGLAASNTIITTIEPFSDLLGLKGGQSPESGEKTAEERIDFIVSIIPKIIPEMDKISEKVKIIDDEVSQINPDRYPEKYKNIEVKSKIKELQNLTNDIKTVIVNGKPMLESAPYLLGMDTPRNYLVIFQNDKEIRPTGGFMTGYSIMKVDKAKVSPTTSDDIYSLDAKYKPSILAPDPIIKYIKGPYVISKNLRFRDMNWSPDFSQSMKIVLDAAKQIGIKDVDGIIAVDTQLLVNLLGVIGPIGVPGFGNFSNTIIPECNCPQVIYELESYADVEGPIIWDPLTGKIILKPKNSDNRKKIIGPLMNSILANAMGQPKEKLAPLFEAGLKSLMEKHVLFYLTDPKVESAVSNFGVGGIIRDYKGDYLHVNDANLGGRKSNLYATSEVEQDIKITKDGSVEKTVTITYKNPEKYDGWLNSVLPTWVRVYVPKGSTLIALEGLETKQDPYEDLGKTVFAGFFQLRPEGVAKVILKYKLPMKFHKEYSLLIQKQPGTDGFLYTVNLGKHSEEFLLKTDKEIKIGL